MKTDGPRLKVVASCFGCAHESSESYVVQSDSGHKVYCEHGGAHRFVGDTRWETPEWCPLLGPAKDALISALMLNEPPKKDPP